MYGPKQHSNVILFPLCDVRGALIRALCDTSGATSTRVDALMFAWRFDLLDGMDTAAAAAAVLSVALATPRESWTRPQLALVRELMALSKGIESTRQHGKQNSAAPTKARQLRIWRSLVGHPGLLPPLTKNRQRKTRSGRASKDS